LLNLLTLEKCIVTLDAIGCQKNIAEKIIDRIANYILQVKNNQQDFKGAVERYLQLKDCQENRWGN